MPEVEILTLNPVSFPPTWSLEAETPLCHSLSCLLNTVFLASNWSATDHVLGFPVLAHCLFWPLFWDCSLGKTCVLQDLGQMQSPPGPLLETDFPSAELQLLFISLMCLIFYVQETIPFSQSEHFINIGWMMSLRIVMKLTYVSQEFVWNQLEVNLVISGVARGEETGSHPYCLREYKSVQFV